MRQHIGQLRGSCLACRAWERRVGWERGGKQNRRMSSLWADISKNPRVSSSQFSTDWNSHSPSYIWDKAHISSGFVETNLSRVSRPLFIILRALLLPQSYTSSPQPILLSPPFLPLCSLFSFAQMAGAAEPGLRGSDSFWEKISQINTYKRLDAVCATGCHLKWGDGDGWLRRASGAMPFSHRRLLNASKDREKKNLNSWFHHVFWADNASHWWTQVCN